MGFGLGLSQLGLKPVGPCIIAKVMGKLLVIFVAKPAGFGEDWARDSSGFWVM